MKTPAYIQKFFFSLALVGYLTVTVFGIVHIAHMKNMDMEHCPFAVAQHVLCEMSFIDHIRAWQHFGSAMLTTFYILALLPLGFISYLNIGSFLPMCTRFYQRRERRRSDYFYQELFSQGILNPKAP